MMVAGFTPDEIIAQLKEPLTLFGFAAQFVFFMRFFVQWLASEKRGESVIPISFWYLSCAGSVMILVYAYYKKDLVITVASVLQFAIYVRNLAMIHRTRIAARSAGG